MRHGWASLAASLAFATIGAVTAQGGWLIPAIIAAMLADYFFTTTRGSR